MIHAAIQKHGLKHIKYKCKKGFFLPLDYFTLNSVCIFPSHPIFMHEEQHSVFLKIKSTCCPFINVGIHLSILRRMGKEMRKHFHSLVVWLFTFNSSLLSKHCEILSKAAAVQLPQSVVSFYPVLLRFRWEHLVATQN